MKNLSLILSIAALFVISSCDKGSYETLSNADSMSFSSKSSRSSGSSSSGSSNQVPGLITAAEWNDLDNWTFWESLLNEQTYSGHPAYWDFYTNNRIAVEVQNGSSPAIDVKVELKKGSEIIWQARTDNFGKAELWIGLFEKNSTLSLSDYTLYVDGQAVISPLKAYNDGVNVVQTFVIPSHFNQVDVAFIVDATGSMGDELEFLKADFVDVITQVQNGNSLLNIQTGSVFYRDEGDDYVVKYSDFSTNMNNTLNFINQQSAGGGGNFPEAVHTALETTLTDLKWSVNAKTRIAFLILDAPPHHEAAVIESLQLSIQEAAQKGIKLIPVVASGINKKTEFLMRFGAMATNGTYVFITDDSGIGNTHLEASVGQHEIEYLNDLMVRLIKKYTD